MKHLSNAKTLLWPIIKWLASAYFRHTEALTSCWYSSRPQGDSANITGVLSLDLAPISLAVWNTTVLGSYTCIFLGQQAWLRCKLASKFCHGTLQSSDVRTDLRCTATCARAAGILLWKLPANSHSNRTKDRRFSGMAKAHTVMHSCMHVAEQPSALPQNSAYTTILGNHSIMLAIHSPVFGACSERQSSTPK